MSQYIDDECKSCDEYNSTYGCMWHDCQIYIENKLGRAEMAADDELERRKDERLGL